MLLQQRCHGLVAATGYFVAFRAWKLMAILANVQNQASPTVVTDYTYGLHYFGRRWRKSIFCTLNPAQHRAVWRIIPAITAISGRNDSWRFLSCHYPIMQVNSQERNFRGVRLISMAWMGFSSPSIKSALETLLFSREKTETCCNGLAETSRLDSSQRSVYI